MEYYDRIIDSIAKKNVGVSEVIGHICRVIIMINFRLYCKELNLHKAKPIILNIYLKHLIGICNFLK